MLGRLQKRRSSHRGGEERPSGEAPESELRAVAAAVAALPAAALDEMRASAIRRLEELCFHDFRISDEYRRLVKQARKEHASRKRARAADGRAARRA